MDNIDLVELERLIKELEAATTNMNDTINALEGALNFLKQHRRGRRSRLKQHSPVMGRTA